MPSAIVLGLCALVLPGLGSFGLWDPVESAIARAALTLGAAREAATILPKLGLRLFGASELAIRLPGALVALATVPVVGWAAATAFGRRAGILAAVTFASFPLFVLEARQLMTDLPAALGAALAFGGMVGAWRARGAKRGWWIVCAAIGLSIASLFAGLIAGALPILGAAAAAGSIAESEESGASVPKPAKHFARIACAIAFGAILCLIAFPAHTGMPSWLLGGTPRSFAPGTTEPTFDRVLELFGFGVFPFGGLALFAPFALVERDGTTHPFAALLLLFTLAFGACAATFQMHLVGEAHLTVLPIVAVALGGWFDRLHARGGRNPLFAALLAIGAVLIARDFHLYPECLATAHLHAHLPNNKVFWPPGMPLAPFVFPVALGFSAGAFTSLTAPPEPRAARRRALGIALMLAPSALFLGPALAHHLVPQLSRHLSAKRLLATFHQLTSARPATPLHLVHLPRETVGVFDAVATKAVADAESLAALFAREPESFALLPRSELDRFEAAAGERRVTYAVADGSSSELVLVAAGNVAADENPLRALVWRSQAFGPPPAWAKGLSAKSTARAMFGGVVGLLRSEQPQTVKRGSAFALALVLRVDATPPEDQKIFVHVEGPAGTAPALVHGDHAPLEGLFPSPRWRPGDYLYDRVDIAVPRFTTRPGRYRILVGFWPGGDTPTRLPITAGASDGYDRAPIAEIEVQ